MTGTGYPFSRGSFLHALASDLDPPKAERELAGKRYADLGAYMREHASGGVRDIEVYPQGSRNLGTTNRDPYTGEFDIDLVFRMEYSKAEITQDQLNQTVNGLLRSYVSVRRAQAHPLAPIKLEKGKRAWTLRYHKFHMDVLPVVPDRDGELSDRRGDPSWLTDKELTRWQATNPRGFADWFREVSRSEFYARKVELAKRADVTVDELPDDDVKTTLQVTVQVLKRHRDHHFGSDPENLSPPSALVTVGAARAYEARTPHGGELAEVITAVVADMPRHLGRTASGQLWVPNPTCARENYADRYAGRPDKVEALHAWLDKVRQDVGRIATVHGAAEVGKAIDVSFGAGLGQRVAKQLGVEAQSIRHRGIVGSTATGGLRVDSDRPHRDHRFYGGQST